MNARIWHVEDSHTHRDACQTILSEKGYAIAETFADYPSARARLETLSAVSADFPDVLLLDIALGSGPTGFDLLRYIRSERKWDAVQLPVLIVSGSESDESAEQSFDLGANDFINKSSTWQFVPRLENVLRVVRLKRDRKQACQIRKPVLLGKSDVWLKLLDEIKVRAGERDPISLFGESGTGKEQLARYVHLESPRADKPMNSLHCGAFSEGGIQSELFGHVKGAFTTAIVDNVGWLRASDGGTLFLDEFADLSAATQGMLNRVFDAGEVQTVGSQKIVTVDVRFITATKKDIAAMVDAGTFRDDVMYRIRAGRGSRIAVPPLRERGGDVELLADEFVTRYAGEKGYRLEWDDSARAALRTYHWPGNVRQLDAVIKTAVSNTGGKSPILPAHLGLEAPGRATSAAVPANYADLDRLEVAMIEAAVKATPNGKNISQAAKALNQNSNTLYSRMKKLGLVAVKPRKAAGPAKKASPAKPAAKKASKPESAVAKKAAAKKSAKKAVLENSKLGLEKSKKTAPSAPPKATTTSRRGKKIA